MKRFRWSGPETVMDLRQVRPDEAERFLTTGGIVDLPADHPQVGAWLALGYLAAAPDEPAPAAQKAISPVFEDDANG